MGQEPTVTGYALLGLLAFDTGTGTGTEPDTEPGTEPDTEPDTGSGSAEPDGGGYAGLTGYELKQRADNTLRFYWVSPATSQVYSELRRLEQLGLVDADVRSGRRTTRRYRITPRGVDALRGWLTTAETDFPVLKHPVALRLLMGHLTGPDHARRLLADYVAQLDRRRKELSQVRAGLGDDPRLMYPAMVADWGLAYYRDEERTVRSLLARLG
jgi:DNA-binding PadR family transcriptional regulator